MVKLTLKDRLMRYMLKRHSTWVSSGELQRIVAEHTTYTPGNVSRRLRELENAGELKVEYRKNHAWYMARPPVDLRQQHKDMIALWNVTP